MAVLPSKSVLLAQKLLYNGKGRLCGLFVQSARSFSHKSQTPPLHIPRSFQNATPQSKFGLWSTHLRPVLGAKSSSIAVRYASSSVDPALVRQMPPPGTLPGATAVPDPSSEQAINAQQAAPMDTPAPDPLLGDIWSPVVVPDPYIGYLADKGVDMGWGTSTLVQQLLEAIQVNTGLSWLGAVTLTILLVRVLTVPLAIRASDTSARLTALGPIIKPIRDRMVQERMQGSPNQVATVKELRAIYKNHNVKPWTAMLPMLIQAPFGFGMFRVTRAMGVNDLPGLSEGGTLWFQNLTIVDPTYILPIIASAALYLSLKIGVDGAGAASSQTMGKYLMVGLPVVSFIATAIMPAITQYAIVVGSLFALGQTFIISGRRMRSVLGIQPLPPKQSSTTTLPPQKRIEGLMNRDPKQAHPEMEEPKTFVVKQLKSLKTSIESAKRLSKNPSKSLGEKLKEMTGTKEEKTRLTPEQKARAEKYDRMRRDELRKEKNDRHNRPR